MRWFEPNRRRQYAVVMKLVDISDLKSGDRNVVWVQLPSAAPMGIWWNVDTPVLETGDRDVVRVRVSLSPPICGSSTTDSIPDCHSGDWVSITHYHTNKNK